MQQVRRIFSTATAILLVGQLVLPGLALAAHSTKHPKGSQTSASPSPTPSASPSPSPTPSASPDPSPSPTPSASPSPSPSPSPSASPSPSPSPSPTPGPQTTTGPTGTTGAPDVCHGNPPSWVFDTTTSLWEPADTGSFSCDPTTHYYLSPEYYFDTQDGYYEILTPAVIAALPSYFIAPPDVVQTVLGALTVGSEDYNMAKALGLLNSVNGILLPNGSTGSDSSNDASASASGQNWVDLTSLVNVINALQSNANSGNSAADSNTQVGNSVTGAASVIADLFNLLASAWSWSNGNLNFFTQTLCAAGMTCNGNVNLDIAQPVSGGGGTLGANATTDGSGTASSTSDTNVNAQDAGNIVNNVNLGAASGDASAADNTAAGNVSSGNALAEVNIMNLINSFISSGSSFFGILNIFGTLNGNILFPAGFLNGLVSSGTGSTTPSVTGPGSTNGSTTTNTGNTNLNSSSTTGIDNNVSTNAASGNATAESNSLAGNVESGVANTVNSLFNLANTSIFGSNAVLVIVNIAGHWVGKIMNLPGGSTESALLTGGATVTSNGTSGPNSNNQSTVTNGSNTNVNANSVGSITNNVNVGAQSGGADANDNTSVGNVTSGNAQALSSVANITNSVINATHWFGVLVINVVGSWLGSVGVAGVTPNVAGYSPVGSSGDTSQANSLASVLPKSGIFAPVAAIFGSNSGGSNSNVSNANAGDSKVLTAAAEVPAPESVASIAHGKDMGILFGLSALALLIAGALTSIDKKLKRR